MRLVPVLPICVTASEYVSGRLSAPVAACFTARDFVLVAIHQPPAGAAESCGWCSQCANLAWAIIAFSL